MKYTIEGFSQAKAIELKLDLADILILRWIVDFANTDRMVKMQVDSKIYFWLKYEGLLRELPILGITKDGLYRRLMRMVEKGILEHTTVKRGGTYSMYRLGKAYELLISDEPTGGTELIPTGYGNDSVGGTELIPDQNNNLLNNKSTKEKSLPKGKEEQAPPKKIGKSYADIFSDPVNQHIKDALAKYIKSCEGRNVRFRVSTVGVMAEFLRKCSKNDPEVAMEIVDYNIDKQYNRLYLPKKNNEVSKSGAVSIPINKEEKAKNPDGSYVTF